MQVFVFGNIDSPLDNRVFKIIHKFKNVNFKIIDPNGDLPLTDNPIVIMDTVANIDQVSLLTENDLDKIVSSPRITAHDYDLGFQLKYLKKIGKLTNYTIIGIPQIGSINYDLLHSIFKKLVAQDMQGS
jgi:hypothetical protein